MKTQVPEKNDDNVVLTVSRNSESCAEWVQQKRQEVKFGGVPIKPG